MQATLNRGPGGLYYTLDATGGQELYFGTDWDYPSLARDCGWNMNHVQRCAHCGTASAGDKAGVFCQTCADNPLCEDCEHETDGTVPCKRCGLLAGDFISAAVDYLDQLDGTTLDVADELFAPG